MSVGRHHVDGSADVDDYAVVSEPGQLVSDAVTVRRSHGDQQQLDVVLLELGDQLGGHPRLSITVLTKLDPQTAVMEVSAELVADGAGGSENPCANVPKRPTAQHPFEEL